MRQVGLMPLIQLPYLNARPGEMTTDAVATTSSLHVEDIFRLEIRESSVGRKRPAVQASCEVTVLDNMGFFSWRGVEWGLRVYDFEKNPIFHFFPKGKSALEEGVKVFNPEGSEVEYSVIGRDGMTKAKREKSGRGYGAPMQGASLYSYALPAGRSTIHIEGQVYVLNIEKGQSQKAIALTTASSPQTQEEKLAHFLFNRWLATQEGNELRRSYLEKGKTKWVDLKRTPFMDLPRPFKKLYLERAQISLGIFKEKFDDSAAQERKLAAALYGHFEKQTASTAKINPHWFAMAKSIISFLEKK